jgi:hypothetical protein
MFAAPPLGALARTFRASTPLLSYLTREAAGVVVAAVEKQVVSEEASAGVYLFRSPAVYLRALAHVLEAPDAYTTRGLFFACPVLNGVLAQGLRVEGVAVGNVRDIKIPA